MKNYFAFFTMVLLVNYLGILTPTYGQWQQHVIDPDIYFTTILEVKDIEDDGDMDVVVAHYGSDMVLLFENNNLTWKRDTIDAFLEGVVGVDIDDFDGDGNLDVVAAGYKADLVAWYKNDGEDPINWIKDTIGVSLGGANVVIAKDINGDGAPDAVANGYFSGDVVWYENNLRSGWTSHIIGTNLINPENMDVNDINDDGKPDVVVAATGSNKVVLYLNNLPDTNWSEIIIVENLPQVFCAKMADIDNDGDSDIVVAGQIATGNTANITWYENDGSEQTWTEHTLTTEMTKSRYLSIKDIDNDGYLDVIANDFWADKILLFKNKDGGQNWSVDTIHENIDQPNGVFTADVDLDNDFDILVTTRNAKGLFWYANPYFLSIDDAESLEDIRISPNPFSTSTTIEYELIHPETVIFTFYNQFGKQVDMIEQKQSAGKQQVIWNAKSQPAGIYYFRLQAGKQVATGKMVLMR